MLPVNRFACHPRSTGLPSGAPSRQSSPWSGALRRTTAGNSRRTKLKHSSSNSSGACEAKSKRRGPSACSVDTAKDYHARRTFWDLCLGIRQRQYAETWMSDPQDLLDLLFFGQVDSESEQHLDEMYLRTSDFERFVGPGRIDLVLGPK